MAVAVQVLTPEELGQLGLGLSGLALDMNISHPGLWNALNSIPAVAALQIPPAARGDLCSWAQVFEVGGHQAHQMVRNYTLGVWGGQDYNVCK